MTTEQVNRDALTRARRALGPQAIDTMLRNGEVQRRFLRYATKGRGQIDKTAMPEEGALEVALEDVFGTPEYAGSRHFAHICTGVNIRRLKQYAAGKGSQKEQLILGAEVDVRRDLRGLKDKGRIAEMLAAEYQGRNVDARPRDEVLKAILARLESIDEMESGKATRSPASDEAFADALSAD